MATSGSATFSVSRDDVIKAALRSLNVISVGETPQTEDFTNCAFALNLLLKSLDADGYLNWLYQTLSFTLTANKASYTIAESGADVTNFRPVKVAGTYLRDTTQTPPMDIPLESLSRQEYDALTPKAQQGVPNSFYYDPQLVAGIWYPWPIPTVGTYSAFLTIERPVQDILNSTQTFDVPQEWFLPLRWILADEVSMEYEVDQATRKEVNSRATYWRDKMADFSQEDASVYFQPNPQGTFRGGLR